MNLKKTLLGSKDGHQSADLVLYCLICIIFIIIIIDTSYARLYDLTSKQSYLETKVTIFVLISFICLAGQYLIIVRLKATSNYTRRIVRPVPFHFIIYLALIVNIAMFVIIGYQLLSNSYFSTALVVIIASVSYGTASLLLGTLAYRFLLWIKSKRNVVIIAYGIASVTLCINALITMSYIDAVLIGSRPQNAYPYAGGSMIINTKNPFLNSLDFAYFISFVISFVSTWTATALLLNNYSKRIGKSRYWIIISIPLIYFLSQFILLNPAVYGSFIIDPVIASTFFSLLFVFSKTIGGLMVGIAFWIIVRNLPKESIVRKYMIISAFGFVLLFGSNQAITLITLPYPPLGLVTISLMGLSAYLIFVGIYYSAVTLAEDVELHKSLRKYIIRDSRLLDSIGYAEMERGIQSIVSSVAEKMEKDTGLQPTNLDESEIRTYIDEVIRMKQELNKDK